MNVWILGGCALFALTSVPSLAEVPAIEETWHLACQAIDTAGFHNDSNSGEDYRPALFNESAFTLEDNAVFNRHLRETTGDPELSIRPDATRGIDLYLSMIDEDGTEIGLQCHRIRANSEEGFSCVNTPPSEMLVINTNTLKFTRSSIGGWAFFGADNQYSGDSIFVEYGRCEQTETPSRPAS